MSDESKEHAPIALTQHAPFALGAIEVRPATLEILRGDERTVLEPRVMQVLVALFLARPDVLSRDELIAQCWAGRIVGDDAINRVIGRLRRLSEADDGASFAIETIPRVGYRLRLARAVNAREQADSVATGTQAQAPPVMNRRRLLAASIGIGGVAVIGAGYWYLNRATKPDVPPDVALLLERGMQNMREGAPASFAVAAATYTRATQLAPQSADAWAGLGLAYAFLSHGKPSTAAAMAVRSQSAIDRAASIDPHDAILYEAKAWLLPRGTAWSQKEALCLEGLRYHPEYDGLLLAMAENLAQVGRNREAADYADKAMSAAAAPDPALVWLRIQMLWGANRLSDADEAASQGIALFPRQSSVWFSRVSLLMYTGRPDEALVMINDREGRPTGIPDWNFDHVALMATALKTRAQGDIDAAVAATIADAHQGAGFGENALGQLTALGRVDDAFAVAAGLFFGRGFAVGDLRFSNTQGAYTRLKDRRTRPLFMPPARAMRHDARFAALVDELGLTRYWKENGKPDYQTGPDPG